VFLFYRYRGSRACHEGTVVIRCAESGWDPVMGGDMHGIRYAAKNAGYKVSLNYL